MPVSNEAKDLLESAVTDRLKTLTYEKMELERKVEELSQEVEEQRFKAMDTMEAGYEGPGAAHAGIVQTISGSVETELGGRKFSIETGSIAKLATSAVLVSHGETTVGVVIRGIDPALAAGTSDLERNMKLGKLEYLNTGFIRLQIIRR